jgi:hypothetical protein
MAGVKGLDVLLSAEFQFPQYTAQRLRWPCFDSTPALDIKIAVDGAKKLSPVPRATQFS